MENFKYPVPFLITYLSFYLPIYIFINYILNLYKLFSIVEEERLQIKHRQKEEKTLQFNYPILSRINSWLKRNLNKAVANYVKENQWRPHQEAISRCKKAHLEQSAYFLTKDLSFRKDQEPILNKEMKHLCQSPAKNVTFKTRIWNPQNWIVTEQCHGESVIIPTGKISDLSFFCYFE